MKFAKKDKKEWSGMPTSEAELKLIKDSVIASEECLRNIDNEKAILKENFDEIHAKTGIPRRVWNFLNKAQYYGNAAETFKKNDDLSEAYDALFKED